MTESLKSVFQNCQKSLRQLHEGGYGHEDVFRSPNSDKFRKVILETIRNEDPEIQERILAEYFSYGPLDRLFMEQAWTEILVNGPDSIWYEEHGRLRQHEDGFLSNHSYEHSIHRLCEKARCQTTVEHPTATGLFEGFRLTVIRENLTHSHHHLSLRRHPKNPWTLERLQEGAWMSENEAQLLRQLLQQRKNFLIIGGTGSGKTSLINALLQTLPANERALVIEDTPEIELPNPASMKLVTRQDPQNLLKEIDQAQLVKHSLRLRPDRLVMGEVRGAEAKDFLMALATGHSGSFGTLHANDPRQALIRLEMLIQMGAPQWNLQAVRRLIQLSLDMILVVGKLPDGKRKFQGCYRITSLEENGFLLETCG